MEPGADDALELAAPLDHARLVGQRREARGGCEVRLRAEMEVQRRGKETKPRQRAAGLTSFVRMHTKAQQQQSHILVQKPP